MGRPYSLIQKADELKAAKDSFEAWQKKSKAEKKALYEAKQAQTGNYRSARESGILYLIPFGVKPSNNIWVVGSTALSTTATSGSSEGASSLITILAGLIVGDAKWGQSTAPTGAGQIIVESIRKSDLAQVKLVEKGDVVAGAGESRITGMPYTYRKKDSISSRFGQKIGAEQEYEAARMAIRTAATGLTNDQKLYFTNQKEIKLSVTAS